jgi:hypothetical protein
MYLLTLSMVGLRPMAIGYVYTLWVAPVFVGLAVLIVVLDKGSADNPQTSSQMLALVTTAVAMNGTSLLLAYSLAVQNSTIELCVALVLFARIFRCSRHRDLFFRCYFEVLALLCASSLVTSLVEQFAPGVDLEIGRIQSGRNDLEYVRTVLFPCSLRWDFAGIRSETARYSHMFNEPGMAPGFLWAGIVWAWRRRRVVVMALFVAGLILTRSTGVALVGGVVLVTAVLFERRFSLLARIPIVVVIGVISFVLFQFTPNYGYLDKEQTHGGSFSDRIQTYEEMADFFNPATLPTNVTLALGLVLCLVGATRKRAPRSYRMQIVGLAANSLINWIQITPMFASFLLFDEESDDLAGPPTPASTSATVRQQPT